MEAVQFKLILPLLFAVFLLIPSIQAREVHYCNKKGGYPVKVNEVEIFPDPVVRGNPATFSIFASSDQVISGGKLVIEVSYFGMHVHTEKHDLCTGTSCPVTAGDFVISHSQVLPGYTPPGSYTLKMKMTGEKDHQFTCINFDFSIEVGSSVIDN